MPFVLDLVQGRSRTGGLIKTTMQDISCFLGRVVLSFIFSLSALFVANNTHAAFGDIVAQYSFPASSFVMSPTQRLMYATIPSQNSIAIINTNTLAVENTVFVGSGPTNLAFSPDGSKAYIANSASNFVVVFDTHTRTVVNSFVLPEQPQDVVFGSQNRLWVLGDSYGQIFQIDATTGASTGPSINGVFIYGGALEISPDRNALYYCDYGLSPAKMYKFNVSTTNATLLWQSPHGPHGSNGQDLTLSHSGSFICFATGSGQNGYQIAKFRTSDMAILGSFNTGPYPREVAFSPDDRFVYAVHTEGEIDVFNAFNFLSTGTIFASGEASELTVDSTGRYLFAGYLDSFWGFAGTRVFDTGRTAPTPTPTAPPTPTPTPAGRATVADFNGDGSPDYVLHHVSTRQTSIWYLDNNVYVGSASAPTLPAGWSLRGVADFNRDSHPDYAVFKTSVRQTGIYYLNNNVYIGSAYSPTLSAGWELVAAADFNGNNNPDYVLFKPSTRQTGIWYLNNNVYVSSGLGPTLLAGWSLAGVADFNRDGQPDYALFNSTTHQTAIWYLSGRALIGTASGPSVAGAWALVATSDFNGDGKPDYVIYNANTRQTGIYYLNNNVYAASAYGPTLPAGWSLTGQ
jgi:YVTN family beta-propeller protein